jgi:hypothetical protein
LDASSQTLNKTLRQIAAHLTRKEMCVKMRPPSECRQPNRKKLRFQTKKYIEGDSKENASDAIDNLRVAWHSYHLDIFVPNTI